jgi:alkylation response protein AidB-like acyl-CoA dehydrogenase
MQRDIDHTIQWAKENTRNGVPVIEIPWVRQSITELTMEVEVLRRLNFRVAWILTAGIQPHGESSMVKAYGTVLMVKVSNVLSQILGLGGQIQTGSKWAPLKGRIEKAYRSDIVDLFGGGALEIQKNIIAMTGLGMPRSF